MLDEAGVDEAGIGVVDAGTVGVAETGTVGVVRVDSTGGIGVDEGRKGGSVQYLKEGGTTEISQSSYHGISTEA